jgi:hypothetical protein
MTFILSQDFPEKSHNDPELSKSRFTTYRNYLQSIREKLPTSAYEFAVAEWHYNPGAHECPHDAWVEALIVSESSWGERQQHRSIQISLRLLGAYHDGRIQLTYKDVESYTLNTSSKIHVPPLGIGHGDWLTDEIRLSESELVVHEIEFSRGGKWIIECADIFYEWQRI